jgi:hypothetical protein
MFQIFSFDFTPLFSLTPIIVLFVMGQFNGSESANVYGILTKTIDKEIFDKKINMHIIKKINLNTYPILLSVVKYLLNISIMVF